MKKSLSNIFKILFILVIIFTGFFINSQSQVLKADENGYRAYDAQKYRGVEKGGISDTVWALCMNSNLTSPGKNSQATGNFTKLSSADDNTIREYNTGKAGDIQKIKRLLYFMYTEFEKVSDQRTRASLYNAVQNEYYHLQGMRGYDTNHTNNPIAAGYKKELRKAMESTEHDKDIKERLEITVYKSNERGTQNLITVKLKNIPVVDFSKRNLNGEEIAGASIQIKQGDKIIEKWISQKGVTMSIKLNPGEYVFHEETAPAGYHKVTDITFEVTSEGKVVLKNHNDNQVKVENEKKLVVIDEDLHINPNGKINTIVAVNGISAIAPNDETGGAAAKIKGLDIATEGPEVVDKINYEGLIPNKEYTLLGELYEVNNGVIVGTAKITKTTIVTASATGNGVWELDFGKVGGLESGKSYVVYETATSTENLVDTDNNNKPDKPQIVEHKNPRDLGQTFIIEEQPPKEVEFDKVDQDGNKVEKARFHLYKAIAGQKLDKVLDRWWTRSDRSNKISLELGEYILEEITTPEGYKPITKPINFSVDENGVNLVGTYDNASVSESKLIITNISLWKEFQFSKVNIGGQEIAGAKIEIKKKMDKTVVESWISDGNQPKTIKLLPGEYILHEVAAPKGYLKVTDIEFKVTESGGIEIVNKNAKDDATVAGEKLTVIDKNEYRNPEGNIRTIVKVGDTTASENSAAFITQSAASAGVRVVDTIKYTGLVAGKNYTVKGELFEVVDGKIVGSAKSTVTNTFTASNTSNGEDWQQDFGVVKGLEAGKTYVIYETATSIEDLVDTDDDGIPNAKHEVIHKDPNDKAQTVVVNIPEEPKEKDVQFSKINLDGKEIAGAQIEIKKEDGTAVTKWTSEENKIHTVKLLPGKYIFHEVVAPEGYEVVTDIVFIVDKDGNVKVASKGSDDAVEVSSNKLIVTDKDKPVIPLQPEAKKIYFSKVNLGGKEIAGAQIQILKDGRIIDGWTSLAGITKELILSEGTYIFHEVVAPEGYEVVTDIVFTVDKDGNITVISKGAGDKVAALGNKLIVTDKEKPTIPEIPEIPEESEKPETLNKRELTKTGEEENNILASILGLVSLTGAMFLYRRKEN